MTYKNGDILEVTNESNEGWIELDREQAEVLESWKMVWEFRTRYEKHWPTPNIAQSLHFALQEIGEADDAWMRSTTDHFARNSEKSPDLRKELSQTAIMLLTAINGDLSVFEIDRDMDASIEGVIIDAAVWIADSLSEYSDAEEDWQFSLYRALSILFSVLTSEDIKETLSKIYQDVIYIRE